MNHHIIITGATRGIGHAAALRFAAKGCLVSICAHSSSEELENTCKELETAGGQCFFSKSDISEPEEADEFIQNAVHTFGVPDLLVNNAGISHIGLLQDMTASDWDLILRTNLSSVFFTCKAVIPHFLQAQKGSIINISSIWGDAGASMEVAYSATKGGVNAFTKALAKELAPSHIPVNAIACGVIDTQMNDFLSPEERTALIEQIPSGRTGRPEEVAALIEQLASASDYLTGQIITLSGGYL